MSVHRHPHELGWVPFGTERRGGVNYVLWAPPDELRVAAFEEGLAELRGSLPALPLKAETRAELGNALKHVERGLARQKPSTEEKR